MDMLCLICTEHMETHSHHLAPTTTPPPTTPTTTTPSPTARQGTWGDELTLRAAADLLRAKVYVITSVSGARLAVRGRQGVSCAAC